MPEPDADFPFDASSPQPRWVRYLNVSADGRLRYAHYVDTYEQYPDYCGPREDGGGAPNDMECNGGHAAEFYTALLRFSEYWNATWVGEGGMEVALPTAGDPVDLGSFAKHSLVREMITRRAQFHPRYGVPPMYYSSCCALRATRYELRAKGIRATSYKLRATSCELRATGYGLRAVHRALVPGAGGRGAAIRSATVPLAFAGVFGCLDFPLTSLCTSQMQIACEMRSKLTSELVSF